MPETMIHHSLEAAVADETITEEAAFCGLKSDDLLRLSHNHPSLNVLVRFRSRYADGRTVMTVSEALAWQDSDVPLTLNEHSWSVCDIRDISALAQ